MRNHGNVRRNILELVTALPELKENYNNLTYHYWVMFDGVQDLDDIPKATPAETIRRNFQKLAEVGEITVPRRIKEIRNQKELEFRTEFSALSV